jgi:hypothetical protein
VSRPLHIEVSDLAKAQIRAAEEWWRVNRAKALNAIREELERSCGNWARCQEALKAS